MFQYFSQDIDQIKNTLESCLNKKCQNFMLPLYNKKKPPAKLIALRQVRLIDDLLIENEKQKYQNMLPSDAFFECFRSKFSLFHYIFQNNTGLPSMRMLLPIPVVFSMTTAEVRPKKVAAIFIIFPRNLSQTHQN